MSTTIVETWATDLGQLGPIYPFVGSEWYLWIAGLAFWIGFHVLQARIEKREFAAEIRSAHDRDVISAILRDV